MLSRFFSIKDLGNPGQMIDTALKLKQNPYAYQHIGKHKVLGLVFMNPSLRTRLSSQKAALQLGMTTFVLNVNQEGWKLELNDGTIMDGENGEHIKEAARVIAQYCDIIGLRCFPSLKDRDYDYEETVLTKFAAYSGKPVISLESATRHPLQALADIMTIESNKPRDRPKVVLSWAPHVKALPQAVPNSFAETCLAFDYDLVIAHPPGYELKESFTKGAHITHNQDEALKAADFVYVKNWSSYQDYGKILGPYPDWMMTQKKLALTPNASFMHCLPIRRNVVAEDAVLDSPRSLVIEQANNRTFAMQAVLLECLKGSEGAEP